MSVGVAAAANYPAPFVSGGSANVAVVYGTGVGVSSSDMVQANAIEADLLSGVTSSGVTTVSGGESFTLEKSSNMLNFGNALDAVYSNLGDEEMDFLADGTYDDGDIDEDYTQTIDLSSNTLSLFADTDYNDKEPTVGFKWTNSQEILSYTIEFDNSINLSEMVDTDMPLLGASYYVLDTSETQIDILDSAEKTSIDEGETVTVNGKVVSISHIESGEVRLSIDGELTDKLSENEYEELDDGSYVVITAVDYNSKETGISSTEFSIGNGKMELIFGDEVQVNDEDVDGLLIGAKDGATGLLDSLTVSWTSDRETFLAEGDSIAMPAFGAISLVYEGIDYPSDSEVISLDNGETLTLRMDNYELPLMWWDGSDALLGEEDNLLVLATSTALNTTWTSPPRTANLTGGLDLTEGDRFLVTSIDEDLSDIETLYYEVSSIENDTSTGIEVVLENLIGTTDETFDALETQDVGDVTITLVGVNGTTAGRAYLNFSSSSGDIYYNVAVSDMGMLVGLPADVSTLSTTVPANLTFTEADKDEDVGAGVVFKVSVKATDDNNLHVSTHNLTAYDEEGDSDVFEGVVPSDLASTFTFDTSGDENDFEVEYFGKEVGGIVKVVAGGEVSSATSSVGNLVVMDSEVSGLNKNLVIVGGSCINSAAATALGVSERTCGAAFTAATGVGAGQFLIQAVEDVFSDGKIALVVAGYESADTKAAADYLIGQMPSTSVGKKVLSSSSTEAVLA
jgi:hypothetical protein